MKKLFVFVISLMVLFFIYLGYSVYDQNQREQRMIQDYQRAFVKLKEGDYKAARLLLIGHDDYLLQKHPYVYYLKNYADALCYYRDNNYEMANFCLKKIPDDYSGEFSEDIKKLKDKSAQEEKDKENRREILGQLIQNMQGVNIGANKQSVINEWGNPERINKIETARGIREQWVYGNGKYVYFMNNVVEAIQQ